jgi:hypothetical protein
MDWPSSNFYPQWGVPQNLNYNQQSNASQCSDYYQQSNASPSLNAHSQSDAFTNTYSSSQASAYASPQSSYSSTPSVSLSSTSTSATSTSSTNANTGTFGPYDWNGSPVTAADQQIIMNQAQQIMGHRKMSDVKRLIKRPANYETTLPGLQTDFIWMFDGNAITGFQHIQQRHFQQNHHFQSYNIKPGDIPELFEAALSRGFFAGHKDQISNPNSNRCPVFILRYYGHPIIVAVVVADQGFDISMFPLSTSVLSNIAKKAGISLSGVNDILKELYNLRL